MFAVLRTKQKKDSLKQNAKCPTDLSVKGNRELYTLLHKYCHLLISRWNFEECLTREFQQTLFCKQTRRPISNFVFYEKTINTCAT